MEDNIVYYKNDKGNPYFEPSEAVIVEHNLYEITEEEFQSLVSELNTIEEIPRDLEEEAKTTRDQGVDSDLLVVSLGNSVFQCKDGARDIKDVIEEAKLIEATYEETINFRLSDNSWREVTLSDLMLVINLYAERKKSIWEQFSVWDQGDKVTPFDLVFEETPTDEVIS